MSGEYRCSWITDRWLLQHALLRCKHFEEKSKTAINISLEIEQIFVEFGLQMGDTPITTDEGANIKASLKDEVRVPCFAHRCSTVLETAWEATREKSAEFLRLTDNIADLRAFIARSGSFQDSLPKSIKKSSGTRPRRSYHVVNESGKWYFTLFARSSLIRKPFQWICSFPSLQFFLLTMHWSLHSHHYSKTAEYCLSTKWCWRVLSI